MCVDDRVILEEFYTNIGFWKQEGNIQTLHTNLQHSIAPYTSQSISAMSNKTVDSWEQNAGL